MVFDFHFIRNQGSGLVLKVSYILEFFSSESFLSSSFFIRRLKNVRYDIPQTSHLACRTNKTYHTGEANLDVYKFNYKISKTENEITKISRTVNKVVSHYRGKFFRSPKSFWGPSTKFLISCFLRKNRVFGKSIIINWNW